MSKSFSQIRRQQLEKRKSDLIEEYEAAQSQLSRTMTDVDRVRLQRQIQQLEQEIENIEQ